VNSSLRWAGALVLAALIAGCSGKKPNPPAAPGAATQISANSSSGVGQQGDTQLTIPTSHGNRFALLHVPPAYDGKTALPLVVFFHAEGESASKAAEDDNWEPLADAKGFFAAFPEGLGQSAARPADPRNNPEIWRDWEPRTTKDDVDDLEFVQKLLDQIESKYKIDASRVYAAGMGNGGSMAMLCGDEMSARFAAVGAVASHLWDPGDSMKRAVPLIYFIGKSDPLCPIGGGTVAGHEKPLAPVIEVVNRWAKMIGAKPKPAASSNQGGVLRQEFGPGKDHSMVDFITVDGMGHVWPGGNTTQAESVVGPSTSRANAAEEMWVFFQLYALG